MHLRNRLLHEQCCVKQDREGEERKPAGPGTRYKFVLLKSNKPNSIRKWRVGWGAAELYWELAARGSLLLLSSFLEMMMS